MSLMEQERHVDLGPCGFMIDLRWMVEILHHLGSPKYRIGLIQSGASFPPSTVSSTFRKEATKGLGAYPSGHTFLKGF